MHIPAGQDRGARRSTRPTWCTASGRRGSPASATSFPAGKPGSGSRPTAPDSSPDSAPSSAASSTPGWRSTSGRCRRPISTRGSPICRRWGPSRPPAPAAAPAGDSLRPRAPARVAGAPGRRGALQGPEYAAGEKLFMTKGCMGCHSLQAVDAAEGADRTQPGQRGSPVAHRRRLAQEHRREPGALDPRAPDGQEGRPDAEPRRHGGRGRQALAGLPPRTQITGFAHGNDCPRPASRACGGPRREDRPVELDHHRRPQADRHPLRRHRVLLLPARRTRGAAASASSSSRADNTFIDPDTYNQLFTMHGTTMIFLAIMPLSVAVLQLPGPAHDRRAGRGVSPAQRVQLLGLPAGRPVPQRRASSSARRRTRAGSATPT